MKRNDLLTGEEFTPSRINQRFSCRENRIKFNNHKANSIRHSTSYINTPLHRNFLILNELMIGKQEQRFHKQFLLGKGYQINVLTHFSKLDNLSVPCIYSFAFITDNEYITIKRLEK